MSRLVSLCVFLAISVGGGLLIGTVSRPGPWYAALAKPSFNPPSWVFAPVWTTLYVMIGVAGWRAWLADGGPTAMRLWAAQMALNFSWSPIFFVLNAPALALAIILALLAVIFAFIVASWPRDRLAGWLFVAYAAWVGFASVLNAAIVWLN
ncbi:MAG: TspO/MBR family protein [Hyphomicrobiaceae bacterium]|nr:TspO/MBR family protein [Hyphomicrobiaceae bacterium]